MFGIGTIVNVVAIIICSLIGVTIGRKLSPRVHELLVRAIGLATVGIGIKMFLQTEMPVVVLLSIVIGGVIGELIGIENILEGFGHKLKSAIRSDNQLFLSAFVSASLIFCVGPMAVLGAISDGINGQHDILFTKSVMDGTVAIAFAASLGIGVIFSFISVLVYQGAITIAAHQLGSFFSPLMMSELTATGGILILGIGFNLIFYSASDTRKIPVGNILPALIVAPFIVWLCTLTGIVAK